MKRRLLFSLLVLLFVACFVWRVTWFPYRAEALYAAVPRQALFVSEHVRLAGRWSTWGAHPLVRGMAVSLGMPREEWDRIVAAPGTRQVMDLLAPRDTLTAYAPMLGRQGAPAWIVASWVGMQGQFLRWGVYKSLLVDFEKRRFRDGRQGWQYRDREGALGDQTLQFAVTEGVLLGCLSRDPDAVCALVEQVERGEAGPAVLVNYPFPADEPEAALDRLAYGDLAGAGDGGVWSGTFTLEPAASASGVLHGPATQLPGLAGDAGGESVSTLAQVLRDTPGVLAMGPVEMLGAADVLPGIGPAVRVLWNQLQSVTPPQGRFFLSLARPAYSGRIMGFKVATLMLGMQLTDAAAAEVAIGGALDAFNGQFNTTLIRRGGGVPGAETGVTTVESVRRGPLSSLGPGEQLSYAVVDGWLIISSNSDALSRVLAERGAGGTPAWARELAARRGGAMGWVDLADAADALTKIAAMQDLLAIARGQGREPSVARRRLALAQSWLGELRSMERLRLWTETRQGDYWVQFQLGPSSTSGSKE
ncbi:MAG: hypothetical protein K8T26_02205 [Lentisphaerae bacterium]|nr:hypothetical protein [Lentisphaerota bacterium]